MGITHYSIYKDDGFSGKDTKRPEFQRMLNDAEEKKFDIIICYKLDRISRNISDFSSLIDYLESLNISFISVVDNFDTLSPMGKAMMYITSVFAQLERHTISQRITDNMYALAEMGYWLGGETPTGFTNERKTFTDSNGKPKVYSVLKAIPDEILLVKTIYSKYIELGSLSKVEKYMLSNSIKTKRGNDWSKNSLRGILENPCYVKADKNVVEYLKSLNINVYGTPNNLCGLLIYKKNKGKGGKKHAISEWIYSLAEHEGIIDANDWLKVQNLIRINRTKAPALGCSHTALLGGLIRCAKCNSPMRIAYGTLIKDSNRKRFYYMCTLKHNSGKTRCDNKNINGLELDSLLLHKLKELSLDKNILVKELKQHKNKIENSSENILFKSINGSINKNTEMINNLINNIALTTDESIVNILMDKISKLKEENLNLNDRLIELKNELKFQQDIIDNCDSIIDKLKNFSKFIDTSTLEEQKQLINSVIEKVIVNGDTGSVNIKFKTF